MLPPSRNRPSNRRTVLAFRPHPPLDARLTLARYGRWGVDPASLYRDGALYRVARVGDRLVPFRLTVAGPVERPRATIAFAGAGRRRGADRAPAGRLLDSSARAGTSTASTPTAAADPVLGPLVGRTGAYWGLRPTLLPDPFEMLVGAISAQQVNLGFAFATRARLVRRYGTAGRVRRRDRPCVSRAGRPGRRAAGGASSACSSRSGRPSTSSGLAQALASGRLDLAALDRGGGRGGRRAADGGPRARPVDGRVVPRAGARAAGRVSRGRPRRAAGGRGPVLQGSRARRRRGPPPGSGLAAAPEPRDPLPPRGARRAAPGRQPGAGGPRRLIGLARWRARSCRWSAPTRTVRRPSRSSVATRSG